jgi:molybdopterin synthase sulfur carrier subunit
MMTAIRVELPSSLRVLAGVHGEVLVHLHGVPTQQSLLDALEADLPMLQGTIRDHVSKRRRPFIRFFACEQDLSHSSPETPLPRRVIEGEEAFLVVGAVAGG